MKVLLDIKDKHAASLMEVLKGLPYLKTKLLTKAQANALEQMQEAIEELRLVKTGK